MGEVRGSDPVNSAEARVSYCPAYRCEGIPDSSHTAAVPAGGGGKVTLGRRRVGDLPLLHTGFFCVKCK